MTVQLPNEDFTEMPIDMSKFKEEKTIGEIMYGWYKGTYIGIKITS